MRKKIDDKIGCIFTYVLMKWIVHV